MGGRRLPGRQWDVFRRGGCGRTHESECDRSKHTPRILASRKMTHWLRGRRRIGCVAASEKVSVARETLDVEILGGVKPGWLNKRQK